MKDKIKPSVKTRIKRGLGEGREIDLGELPVYVVNWEQGTVTCYLPNVDMDPIPQGWGPFEPPKPYVPHPDWRGLLAEHAHYCSLNFRASLPNPNMTTSWWDKQEVSK